MSDTPSRRAETAALLAPFAGAKRDSLIPVLQRAQEVHGYLSADTIAEIGRHLKVPASKVYGVATFYNQFRFTPKGRFHLMLCRGTACHVKGSLKLLEAVMRALKIRPGQTSRDGSFSLEVVACMGACGLAPALSVNGQVYAKVTPRKLERILADCRSQEEAHVRA